MSALSDLLHSIVNRLPFHAQQQADDAHTLVEAVDKEISDTIAVVKNFVQASGVKTNAETQEPLGTDQNKEVE